MDSCPRCYQSVGLPERLGLELGNPVVPLEISLLRPIVLGMLRKSQKSSSEMVVGVCFMRPQAEIIDINQGPEDLQDVFL